MKKEVRTMAWLEITVYTPTVEATAAALTALGFSDLVMEDQQELESFLQENRSCWDYIDETLQRRLEGLSQIRLYLQDTDSAALTRLEDYVQGAGLAMSSKALPDTNWEESWKENYPPQEVGKGLVVLPYWLAEDYAGTRRPVILNPGLTFGTGAHPSTRMVMEAMEELLPAGARCLDLGSGSGILSITALRLGAKETVGVDIDSKAEDAARENAAYNGFTAPTFTVRTGSVTDDRHLMDELAAQHWDVVLVNIVADVIIRLAPVLPRLLGKDSVLICSGILDTRLEDVTAALRGAGLTVQSVRAEEEWRCLVAKK